MATRASTPRGTFYASDGSGTMTVSPSSVAASSSVTETFTYTAVTGGISNGSISIVIPSGGTAPQPASGSTAGYVTTNAGSAAVSGTGPWTITVTGLTLASNGTVAVKYGDTSVNAAGAATVTSTTGTANFTAKEASVSSTPSSTLGTSPQTTVYAAD